MTLEERIEQFRHMAKANPDDELAHFGLASVLMESKRHAEATPVLRHVLRISPTFSRAYAMLGEAYAAQEDLDSAVATWETGYRAAMERGDLMPAGEMRGHLERLGAEVPVITPTVAQPASPDDDREPGDGELRCVRTGRIGRRLEFEPFEDEVGEWIRTNISQESWDAWMEFSVKVINELRLDLAEPEAQKLYDEHMQPFLRIPAELFEGKEYE